jgi:hypothetical protein
LFSQVNNVKKSDSKKEDKGSRIKDQGARRKKVNSEE